MLFGLKMDGYLFLGSSEYPLPIIQNLEVINKKWKIYKNLETKRLARFDAFSLPELKSALSLFSKQDTSPTTSTNLAEVINIALVNELDYLLVCIEENNHVVKTYGDTSKFLLQKNFNLNLAELSPRPLATAFNTLTSNAIKINKKVTVNGIKIKNNNAIIIVSLSITPLPVKKGEQKLLLIIFNEDKPVAGVQQENIVFDEKIYLDQYTMNLEEGMKELKDKLHSTYLQLDASNENMQSFNQELLSANEEMQSTNEDMQSVNEEMQTITAEHELKKKELVEINDDLNYYFECYNV